MVCPTCEHVFSFALTENFFLNTKKVNPELERQRESFLKSKPVVEDVLPINEDCDIQPVKDLSDDQIVEICEIMCLKNITPNHLRSAEIFVNVKEHIFYFPMKSITGKIVGYKTITNKGGEWLEQSIPDNSSFGIIMTSSKKVQKSKSAIVVLNLLDYLVLSGENLNRR